MKSFKIILVFLTFLFCFSMLFSLLNCDINFGLLFSKEDTEAFTDESIEVSTSESTEVFTEESSEEFIQESSESSTEDIELPDLEIFSELTYVAFGDSITYGADYTRNYSQMDYPYPVLVAESLGLLSVKNKGVSGATFCTNNLDRVCMTDRILSYTEQADIISVMLGVNDYMVSLPLGTIYDNTTDTVYGSLNLIAEHLTTTQKDSFVFFMTPYKCRRGSSTYKDQNSVGYTLGDLVDAVKTVAEKYGIPVLDLFNEGQYELEMYKNSSDGLHPSQEFVREYTAPQIAEFIAKNYRVK